MQGPAVHLQMYLIDHASGLPDVRQSGECYLQDNTYLHNINANPYRRPNSRDRIRTSASSSTTSGTGASCATGARASAMR